MTSNWSMRAQEKKCHPVYEQFSNFVLLSELPNTTVGIEWNASDNGNDSGNDSSKDYNGPQSNIHPLLCLLLLSTSLFSHSLLLSIPVISEKHSISRLKQLNQFPSSQANHNHLNVIAALTERPQRAKTSSILSLLLAFTKTQRVVLQLAEARTYSALWNSDA